MTVTVFASSSSGNCTLVSQGDSHLLIDAGISMRRIGNALGRFGLKIDDLTGILLTHEHNDHVSALPMLCKHHHISLYAPRTVANHLCRCMTGVEEHIHRLTPEESITLGGFTVTPFPTPHDAEGSVGYRIEGEGVFGFCTDCGCITDTMLRYLRGCGTAVIEANHDEEMLRYGSYPVSLKRRILSDYGHLSNESCGKLAVELARSGVVSLILGHLSQENNRPALAKEAVCDALSAAGYPQVRIETAPVLGELRWEVAPCST